MKHKYLWVCIVIIAIVSFASLKVKIDTRRQSTISVVGTGTVSVQPDMVQLTITLSNVARTTQLAQEAVNRMVAQALEILKEFEIEDRNISTASLSFRTEYDYNMGRRTLVGQRAEQILSFSIDDIKDDNRKVSSIIDKLTLINGIELNHINFNIKDNTEYFVRSRELAFQKAIDKANQYANLSGLKTVKVLSITEEGNQYIAPISNRAFNQVVAESALSRDDGSTMLPAGEIEITTRINVVFLLK